MPAACARAWPPTPTTTTSTGSSPVFGSSSAPAERRPAEPEGSVHAVAGDVPRARERTAHDRTHLAGRGQPVGVAGGVPPDVLQVVVGGLPDDLRRDATHHRAGRHARARGD